MHYTYDMVLEKINTALMPIMDTYAAHLQMITQVYLPIALSI